MIYNMSVIMYRALLSWVMLRKQCLVMKSEPKKIG